MSKKPEVSAIVTCHHEGVLLGPTLGSLGEAVESARREGITIEPMAFLDRPSSSTLAMFGVGAPMEGLFEVSEVDYGDQGVTRNHAAQKARGRYVAFLDGDDLWSFNWLTEAYKTCRATAEKNVVHPEFNVFFENYHGTFVNIPSSSDHFDPDGFRAFNYWDALCFAERSVYLEHPYNARDILNGFALEDWHWGWETYAAGINHVIAPDTVHFKRRRARSQSAETNSRRAMPALHPFLRYDWPGYVVKS